MQFLVEVFAVLLTLPAILRDFRVTGMSGIYKTLHRMTDEEYSF
jgi:hypothetical protein